MRTIWRASIFVGMSIMSATALAQPSAPQDNSKVVAATIKVKTRTGDLDELLKSRVIRIAVPYSKTMYYVVNGAPQGITYELGKAFESYLNRKYPPKSKHAPIHVIMFSGPRDKLLPSLNEGLADVAAAAFTITPERQKLVDFADPVFRGMNKIVVTGPQSPKLASLDDLAGQDVFLRKSSSAWEEIAPLNERLQKEHKSVVNLREVPGDLEDEDLLEMVNAGLLSTTVVNDQVAKLWSTLFTKLQLHSEMIVSAGDAIGWAIRKNSPQLMAAINDFLNTHRQGTTFGNSLLQKYGSSTEMIRQATSPAAMKQFEDTAAIFRKYSSEQRMDYLEQPPFRPDIAA